MNLKGANTRRTTSMKRATTSSNISPAKYHSAPGRLRLPSEWTEDFGIDASCELWSSLKRHSSSLRRNSSAETWLSLRDLQNSLREVEVEETVNGDRGQEEDDAEVSLDQLVALVEREASEESLEEDTEWLMNVRTSALIDAAEVELPLLSAYETERDSEDYPEATEELLNLLNQDGECTLQAASPTGVMALSDEELLIFGGSVYDAVTEPAPVLARAGRTCADRKEWTAAEDETIRSLVQIFGTKWRRIAELLPGRSDDSVRNRWNRLQATLAQAGKGGAAALPTPVAAPRTKATSADGKPERIVWTAEEDDTILTGVQEMGHRWGKIAPRLPGRTEHAIRNRFHRLQSMRADQQRLQSAAPPIAVPVA